MKRTFVFEDQYFDLVAIKAILGKIREVQFVGADVPITTVGEALEACAKLRPEVIIADADISGDKNAGSKFVRDVKEQLPDVRVLGLTRHSDCYELLRRAGCDIVVDKNLIENDVEAEKYFRETIVPRPKYGYDQEPVDLTPDEDKVLRHIRDGMTEDQIALLEHFGSRRTVQHIKASLFRKFGATNMANLIDAAYRSGNLNPNE